MFKHLITIQPLGFLYGSAGGFLSPENLVGRSQAKFPPDAATLSGLFFSANKVNAFTTHDELKSDLFVAGPFWAEVDKPQDFYVPLPWTKIIGKEDAAEWQIVDEQWTITHQDLKPKYQWQRINAWSQDAQTIKSNATMSETPWKFVPILHPKIQKNKRCVEPEDGLFLENAVQMENETCLVYLSTQELPNGWYRFGGENHLVEITSIPLAPRTLKRLEQPIGRAFALITPAVWGSSRLSFRYPQQPDFPKPQLMLTDKPIPYRFRRGGQQNVDEPGRLGRGRYAVSPGSVYVLSEPLNKSWWDWPENWFPDEGFSLKRVGCGFCLPLSIPGLQ